MQTNFQFRHPHFFPALFVAVASVLLTLNSGAAPTDDLYLLGPDSMSHTNVPHGKVIGPLTLASDVFTNTTRNYWIYVPAQYDPSNAACLMIFQDGHSLCEYEWRMARAECFRQFDLSP